MNATSPVPASVNHVPLHRPGEVLRAEELRQRACAEMLRQEAQRQGLLAADDTPGSDGSTSEAASQAIEALLQQSLQLPEPDPDDCRRYFDAHAAHFSTGERVHARHILFALTPGMDLSALRTRAEACLVDVRCHDGGADKFAPSAEHLSNCPSGARGGDLGWLTRSDCVPEFAQAIFGEQGLGVLPRLVHSRFGLHVVEVLAREAGTALLYESVQGRVAATLRQRAYVTALRQYLLVLAGDCLLQGVDFDCAQTSLVQ